MPAETDLLTDLLGVCDERGDAPALTDQRGRTLTFRQLGDRIRGTAHHLRQAGLRPDDRMLFSVRPSPESVVLALGAVAAGATVVFVDPGVGPDLFAARLALIDPSWAAAESVLYAASSWRPLRAVTRRRGLLLPDYGALPVRHVHAGRWLPGVPRGSVSMRRLFRPAPRFDVPARPDQDAVVVFTSGTTDAPKAAVHTRRSLGAGLSVLSSRCALGPGDRVHTDQFLLGLPALVGGAHWSLGDDLTGATHTFFVPTDLAVLLDAVERGEKAVPTSLRCVLVGAAPVLPPLLRRARKFLPDTELLAVYGSTEILPIAVATAEEKIAYPAGDLVGEPLPGVRVEVADDGELLVSGDNLCRGYLGEPPMAKFATGDLGVVVDGRVVLTGRKKDMIIRGRTNVYPALHEPAIAALDGVDEAMMVGVPDEIGDERIVLAVSPTGGDRSARSALLDGHPLADRVRAALPTLIDAAALPDEVVVVNRMPTAGRSRKPDRVGLRAMVDR